MISRPVAVALLAAGCLTAAAGGAYLSVRQTAEAAPAGVSPTHAVSPVAETEAIVEPSKPAAPAPAVEPEREAPVAVPEPVRRTPARPAVPAIARTRDTQPRDVVVPAAPVQPEPAIAAAIDPRVAEPTVSRTAAPVEEPAPQPAPAPRFEEIVIPSSSVLGLELESALTTERAQVEDRVDARVARDVYADGRLVIPAGARVVGIVTEVERGGKVKERARLGLRFHTLVLADGRQLDLRTDTIYREGESPANDSSKKIGGAAVGGAVLGAIMGGKKGAVLGGIAGAAGGTAAVMSGDRHAATLAIGTVVNARLAAPLSVEVERR